MTTKRFWIVLVAAVLCAGASACNDEDGDPRGEGTGEVQADSADGID